MSKNTKKQTTETAISTNDLWVIIADSATGESKYLVTLGGWNPNVKEALLFPSQSSAEQFHNLHMYNRRDEGDLIITLNQALQN